jgi:hypothetical protein
MSIDTALERNRVLDGLLLPWEDYDYSPDEEHNITKRYSGQGLFFHSLAEADSVRTRIRKAIVSGLKSITASNGYNVTVGDVNANVQSREAAINYPRVNISFPREEYRSASGQHSLGWLPKKLFVDLTWDVQHIDSLRDEEARALADTERYFLNNRHIPDSDSNATVYGDTMFMGNDRQGLEGNSPAGQVITHLQITYLQAQLDPTATVASVTRPLLSMAPPTAVSISKRDDLRDALIRNLQQITLHNGYNSTMKVNQQAKPFEGLLNYVEVNVIPEPEEVRNAEDFDIHDMHLHKEMTYRIEAMGTQVDDIVDEREEILADIEHRLMNNFTLPDSNGRSTALACIPLYNEPLGIGTNEPDGILRLVLKCFYRQEITDPTKPVSS